MDDSYFLTLAATAATVGALHSLAPDHWVPFAAVGRARGWTGARTARVAAVCGFGHVTLSALLGLVAAWIGLEVLETLGRSLESLAGMLLIAFGIVYGLWGARRAAGERLHGHSHAHYDHVHDPSVMSVGALFVLFTVDVCVAVIPLVMAAVPLGIARVAALVLVYEAATVGTMVALVLPAHAGARVFKAPWLDRYGDALAGGLIVATGVVVSVLGW
jgi:hypothetical protein